MMYPIAHKKRTASLYYLSGGKIDTNTKKHRKYNMKIQEAREKDKKRKFIEIHGKTRFH